MKAFIIPTSQTEHLGKKITTEAKNFKVIFPKLNREGKRYFPDGEVYTRISKINGLKGKRVIVLHSGAPEPNKGLIELELILQILKNNNVKPEVFFSYFPYGMQDKIFEKGETNAAQNLIEKLVSYYRVKKIYTIDAHFWGRKWVKKYQVINISATPILIEKTKKDFNESIVFLSPDFGGKRRVKISGLKKKRIDSYQVEMISSKVDFKGRVVGVIDDAIKTGGTLLKFCQIAKKSGAEKVIALVTHGVLPTGISKIKKKYSKLYLANTIKQKEANVDITDLILKAIAKS